MMGDNIRRTRQASAQISHGNNFKPQQIISKGGDSVVDSMMVSFTSQVIRPLKLAHSTNNQ